MCAYNNTITHGDVGKKGEIVQIKSQLIIHLTSECIEPSLRVQYYWLSAVLMSLFLPEAKIGYRAPEHGYTSTDWT